MRDIAQTVTAAEFGTPVRELSTAQYQRVYTALYRTHLPRLERAGVLEYERARGLVRSTGRLERDGIVLEPAPAVAADPSLSRIETDPVPASRQRTRRAVLGLTGLTLSGLLLQLSLIAGFLIGGLIIAAFLFQAILAVPAAGSNADG